MRVKQQRLVADLRSALPFGDEDRTFVLAAIASGEKAGTLADTLPHFGYGNRIWCLPAAAHSEIANADHGKARAVRLDMRGLSFRYAPIERAEWRERRGQHAGLPIPPERSPKRHVAVSPLAVRIAQARRWCGAALRPCARSLLRRGPSCAHAPAHPQAEAVPSWRDFARRSPGRS